MDCPGHDILMATMLNGAAVMDAALLLIASNETCPQPQTSEHLAAVEIMQLKYIIILQNKIDLIKESQAREQYSQVSLEKPGEISPSDFVLCLDFCNNLCMSEDPCFVSWLMHFSVCRHFDLES